MMTPVMTPVVEVDDSYALLRPCALSAFQKDCMLKHVDVFSGIGGFTLALKGVSETKMYCDISPTSQQILRNLMRKGKVPSAPIVDDVKDLSKALTFKFDIMTAGFPCFPAGTPVQTALGLKPIENVGLGDEVMTHAGRYMPLVNIQRKRYSGGMVSFRCEHSPHEVTCTENHPLYAKLPGREAEWTPASVLTTEHLIGVPYSRRSVVPTFGSSEQVDLPTDWFTIGFFLATDLSDTIWHLKTLGLEAYLSKRRDLKWWTFLSTLGQGAYGHTVPQWVEDAPVDLLQAFVDGYIAADGCNRRKDNEPNRHLSTSSMDVAYGLQRVLMKLGHIASLRSASGTYCLEWAEEDSGQYCRHGHGWLKVAHVSTSSAVQVPVFNFEVEGDNSYVVRNLSVHNCTGLSECGKREGLANVETALVSYLVTLARKHRPPLIMLENVPPITEPSVLKAVTAPFARMGYRIRWTLVPAYAAGLPHKRMRWFCAVFHSLPLLKRVAAGMSQHHRREPPRCTAEKDPTFNKRYRTLGYTVVPACIVLAFKHLAAATKDGHCEFPLPTPPDLGLTIRQDALVFRKPLWPTPRTTPGSSKTLTARVAKDLPTTVRFEVNSTSQFMNIDWAEYLMGYPRGWTSLT